MDSNQDKCEKMDIDETKDKPGPSTSSASCERRVNLLDLSDDVLLLILKRCGAQDLKALGFSCARLGTLIVDRTLWGKVDARGQPSCRQRVAWLMTHGFHDQTTEIHIEGYARQARGCLGHINRTREEMEAEADAEAVETESKEPKEESSESTNKTDKQKSKDESSASNDREEKLARRHLAMSRQHSRFTQYPSWPEAHSPADNREACVMTTGECPGPQFTIAGDYLMRLNAKCPKLTTLSLEYCNINYSNTKLSNFPRTIKNLSLRGSKCYNLALDRSLLFRIQEYLPDLELLDVSECEWVEPATLLPISKLPYLKHLLMMDCYKLSEFVAYASLAARYGFKMLETLDLRGSPVGDSEVSALGWLPELRELRLRPPPRERNLPAPHSHYREPPTPHLRDAPLTTPTLLAPWELQEPEYFRNKPEIDDSEQPEDTTSRNGDCGDHRVYPLIGITEGCILYPGDSPSTSGLNGNSDRTKRASTNNAEDDSTPPKKRTDENDVRRPVVVKVNTEMFKPSTSGVNQERLNVRKRKIKCSRTEACRSVQNNSNLLNLLRRGVGDPSHRHGNTWYEEDLDFGNGEDHSKRNSKVKNAQKNEETAWNGEAQSTLNGEAKIARDGQTNAGGQNNENKEVKNAVTDKGESSQSGEGPSSSNKTKNIEKQKYCDLHKNEQGPSNQGCSDEETEESQDKAEHNGESSKRQKKNDNTEPTGSSRNEVDQNQNEEDEDDDSNPNSRRVLYVNVGNRHPLVYSIENDRVYRQIPSARSLSSLFFPPQPHLDPTSLVTDSAIRRFGRADTDVVGYVYIGTNGLRENDGRPDRSNLRSLTVTGFRHITDRTLVHLATAAPYLETLDLSETNVTAHGVENFRSLRPDCVVTYSKFLESKEARSCNES